MQTLNLPLNFEQAQALRKSLWLSLSLAEKAEVFIDQPALLALYERLGQLQTRLVCSHCEAAPIEMAGLCSACHAYKKVFGSLPEEKALINRHIRKDT